MDIEKDLVETPLTRNNCTKVYRLPKTFKNNAINEYLISDNEENILASIKFQTGASKENGINGIFMEDMISICIERLREFQKSKFKRRENAIVITKLEEALMWLNYRYDDRVNRNVDGTMKL